MRILTSNFVASWDELPLPAVVFEELAISVTSPTQCADERRPATMHKQSPAGPQSLVVRMGDENDHFRLLRHNTIGHSFAVNLAPSDLRVLSLVVGVDLRLDIPVEFHQ